MRVQSSGWLCNNRMQQICCVALRKRLMRKVGGKENESELHLL